MEEKERSRSPKQFYIGDSPQAGESELLLSDSTSGSGSAPEPRIYRLGRSGSQPGLQRTVPAAGAASSAEPTASAGTMPQEAPGKVDADDDGKVIPEDEIESDKGLVVDVSCHVDVLRDLYHPVVDNHEREERDHSAEKVIEVVEVEVGGY